MIQRLNFKNPNRGRQPRANPFLRAWRITRRKRLIDNQNIGLDTNGGSKSQPCLHSTTIGFKWLINNFSQLAKFNNTIHFRKCFIT